MNGQEQCNYFVILQKCVTSCNYNLKASKSITMQSSLTTMKACRIVHAGMNCHVFIFKFCIFTDIFYSFFIYIINE